MKLPVSLERFLWGVLLSVGPFIVSCVIYAAGAMVLDIQLSDLHMFLVAGGGAAAYWALEGEWFEPHEPYSASLIVTNVGIALIAGATLCVLHAMWLFYVFEWLSLPMNYIGIPIGLIAGACMVMGGRRDFARVRREKKLAKELATDGQRE